jgi:hypothetical protein
MTQRLKSTLKASAAILFAFALVFMNVMPAFADEEEEEESDWKVEVNVVAGTPASPAQAAITKQLRVPEGTDIPVGAVFTFKAEPYSFNGQDKETYPDVVTAKLPTLTLPSITIAAGDTTVTDSDTHITTVTKESAAFLTTEPFAYEGIFAYKITENAKTAATYPDVSPDTITTFESEAEYILEFHVYKNASDVYYIKYVVAKHTKDDTGETEESEKVDPTPGGDGENYFTSQMIFINDYTKTNNGTDPEDPEQSTLYIDKTVEGTGSDQTIYFPFKIILANPSLNVTLPQEYKAYIVDADGDVITNGTAAGNGVPDGDASDPYYIFTADGTTENEISLKHGEYLTFLDTPVGMTWIATEDLSSIADGGAYTPSVDITVGGATPVHNDGAPGQNLGTDTRLIGEAVDDAISNSAKFKNDTDETPPTGIIISNLPYVGLILLALASLAAYVALKTRQRRRAAAEAVYFD